MSSVTRVGPASIEAVKYSNPLSPNTGSSVCTKLSARSADVAVGEVMQLYPGEIVLADHGVGEPLAIGGERHVERAAALAGVDEMQDIVGQLDRVQMQMIVLQNDARAIGRPAEQVEITRVARAHGAPAS